ncbi:MAG: MoaD family protein [Candidatus Nezhaarchaeales archaeon]
MITVTVKYFTAFSTITCKKSEKLLLKEDCLNDLLSYLAKKYGTAFEEHLKRAVILVNGRQMDASVKLKHGDEVVISHPVGGG